MPPGWVLQLFDASDYMMAIGIPALRILSEAWLMAIPNLAWAAALQGLSLGTKSMYLNLIRQALLPVIFALILSKTGVLDLIWTGFVLAAILCLPVAWTLWKKAYQQL